MEILFVVFNLWADAKVISKALFIISVFVYFLAVLGLHCYLGFSLLAMRGAPTLCCSAGASLVGEHRLWSCGSQAPEHRVSSCDARA